MRITPIILFLTALSALADPAPTTPTFWLDRAARDVAAAKDVVEYDGPSPRVTAFETAADLYRADPIAARRKLLEDKLAAGEAQLDAATQPWRRWYGHLVLARVYRAALNDDPGYRRHLAAVRKLEPFLPKQQKEPPFYDQIRGAQFAAAGDADNLRKECAAATAADRELPIARPLWYDAVIAWARELGLHDGAATTVLDQLAADASVLPPGDPSRDYANQSVAEGAAEVGEYALALEALRALDGRRKIHASLRILQYARRDGRTDVAGVAQKVLSTSRPPAGDPVWGDYLAELAATGETDTAIALGRAALKQRAALPELFYAALARGFTAAGDEDDARLARRVAREACDASPEPRLQACGLLTLATACAAARDWDGMNRHAADAAAVEGVTDSMLSADRHRLVRTLLDARRWDDVDRQLAPIKSQRSRESWTPLIVAAQLRAGETERAITTARNPGDGFIRARALRRIAIERAERSDLVGLPEWIDQQLDTPLRRAATNLAVAQVLAGKPTRATGFPPDGD